MAPTGHLSGPGGTEGPRRPPRAPRRARWVLAALLLVPLLEVVVVVLVGQWIGPWWTFLALVALSLLGVWLVRREGTRTWRRLQESARAGATPAKDLSDAALIFVGGVLLLAPGFLTGLLGLFLVLPFTRPVTRGWLRAYLSARVMVVPPRPGAGGVPGPSWPGGRAAPGGRADDVIEGEIVGDDEAPPQP